MHWIPASFLCLFIDSELFLHYILCRVSNNQPPQENCTCWYALYFSWCHYAWYGLLWTWLYLFEIHTSMFTKLSSKDMPLNSALVSTYPLPNPIWYTTENWHTHHYCLRLHELLYRINIVHSIQVQSHVNRFLISNQSWLGASRNWAEFSKPSFPVYWESRLVFCDHTQFILFISYFCTF